MLNFTRLTVFLAIAITASLGFAQSSRSDTSSRSSSRSRYRPRLGTPYFYGGNPYTANPYQLRSYPLNTPIATPGSTLPPVTGPIEKYSPIEYGQIVKMAVEAARKNNPAGDGTQPSRKTIVEVTTQSQTGSSPSYTPVSTSVADILDRAIFLLPTGEEMRLRGVTIPSNTDTDEVSRLYAKEAILALRQLTEGKEIYVLLDDPLRDGTGRLLGTVLLSDGTELNRRMIQMGYGTVKEEDFGNNVDFSDLSTAQAEARTKRLGIWSANF